MLLFSVNTAENIPVKTLCFCARKLPKVTNQHMMTFFCTQTIRTSFLVILLLFSINTVKNLHVPKVEYHLHENLPKMKTNPRWLRFSPKSFVRNFWSYCYCFPSIRLKNITVKSLGHLARKLPKVTNQHMMTSFGTQIICTWFSVILLLFPINMVKKGSEQKNRTLNTKTYQNGNQSKITTFFNQIFCTYFSAILILFPINTTQKYSI